MTALADFPVAQAGRRAWREPGSRGPGPAAVPAAADRSGVVRDQAKTMRSWPLLVLAVPAAAEVWSGWVGIAQKTGFGAVPLLPGIWSSLHLDTAVTLPVGVECYAAYALRAWLAGGHAISDRTRRFARWSAICSFALGMAGQVAFHLMDQDHVTRAPWVITTLVSCLPVLVLGMGTALAHMLREDAAAADQPDGRSGGPAGARSPGWSAEDQLCGPSGPASGSGPRPDRDQPDQVQDQQAGTRITVRTSPPPRTSGSLVSPGSATPPGVARRVVSSSPDQGGVQASLIALRLATAGKTRVPAGTAQRRGQGVQREPERTRPPAQCRIRQRAGRRPVAKPGPGSLKTLPRSHNMATLSAEGLATQAPDNGRFSWREDRGLPGIVVTGAASRLHVCSR